MTVPWAKGRTFLIAEAGVNHNGDERLAIQMVELAARAGADAVKFQTFRADKLATAGAGMASYQERNTGSSGSQLDMLRQLELPRDAHLRARRRAEELGIAFFSTGFDDESNDFLESLDQPLWKIPSGEITNYPYLVRIARLGRPTILSTGMATVSEVAKAVETLEENGLSRELLCVLHCNTEYPTPMEDVNLRAMERLGGVLDCAYGYSDHTQGLIVSIAAVARGALVLEKHFTLDRSLPGPDQTASMSPEELREWVSAVRATEVAMGSAVKTPTPSEKKNRPLGRKVIVAAKPIMAGETFSADNLTVKRAGGAGITPMRWPELMHRTAPRSYHADEPIEI
jgi:N,N'-diacetyllegionaminate synthase